MRTGDNDTMKLYKKGLLYSTPNHSGISAVLQLDQESLAVGSEDGAITFLSEQGDAMQGEEEEARKDRTAPSSAAIMQIQQHEVLTADEEAVGAIASDREARFLAVGVGKSMYLMTRNSGRWETRLKIATLRDEVTSVLVETLRGNLDITSADDSGDIKWHTASSIESSHIDMSFRFRRAIKRAHTNICIQLVVLHDNNLASIGYDQTLRAWDSKTTRLICHFDFTATEESSSAFNPPFPHCLSSLPLDGKAATGLVVGLGDGTVNLLKYSVKPLPCSGGAKRKNVPNPTQQEYEIESVMRFEAHVSPCTNVLVGIFDASDILYIVSCGTDRVLKLWRLFLESIAGNTSASSNCTSSNASGEIGTSESEHDGSTESNLTLADQVRHPAKVNVLLGTAERPGHFLVGDVSGRVVGYTISASRPE